MRGDAKTPTPRAANGTTCLTGSAGPSRRPQGPPACGGIRGWHSRGYLPHFDGGEIPQTIAFRLADALPAHIIGAWRTEAAALSPDETKQLIYHRAQAYMDSGHGEALLRVPRAARIVEDALLHFDGDRYRLHAWVVMPNHVHALCSPLPDHSLSAIVHSWKSFTANAINAALGRQGKLWQEDYFDRFIRDAEHYDRAVAYIGYNPVEAGLCTYKEDWPWGSAKHTHR